jgi:hypothetical protein
MVDMRDLEHNAALQDLLAQPGKDLDEEDDEADDFETDLDELYSFDDVIADVHKTFAALNNKLPWFPPQWVTDYLATFSEEDPHELDRFDEELGWVIGEWTDLKDFFQYLGKDADAFQGADDLRGFHLWEYLAENAVGVDEDDGRTRAEVVRDLFVFLAGRGSISSDLRFLQDANRILAQDDALTPFPRPEPRDGSLCIPFISTHFRSVLCHAVYSPFPTCLD